MREINLVTYSQFKTLVAAKGLLAQYFDNMDAYFLFASESGILWQYRLIKDGGADQTDFETTQITNYNKPLEYRTSTGFSQAASEGTISTTAPTIAVHMAGRNSSGNLTPILTDAAGIVQTNASTLPLPTGAALDATLQTINTGLSVINANLTNGNNASRCLPLNHATYSAATTSFTPGATPQDVFTVTGSATKVIRIIRMSLSTTQTTAGINTWFLLKRSTANSGGTSTSLTTVSNDSNDAAGTAVARQYTANPTAGTLVGTMRTFKILGASLTSILHPQILIDFTDNGLSEGIVLRGITQVFALNFNGAALPAGLAVSVDIEWTEE